MALYIGCNYHPHDWARERYPEDIRLMKAAHFNMVRIGHLCWDSFEPEEGRYTFEWCDEVMDLCAANGMGVLLDLSTRPAPVWVHRKCPGCDIYGPDGTKQAAVSRYMEDVTDPEYQYYALRFVERLINRYKDHPALKAFGLCNELGAGYLSHSPGFRKRFIGWLEEKYHLIEVLNHAWQTQRWSRRLPAFEDVEIPCNQLAVGSPESWLDLKRFISEGFLEWLEKLAGRVAELAPEVPHSSNHYADHPRMGFDYSNGYERFVDIPGVGYYPGYDFNEWFYRKNSGNIRRLGETGKPLWCLEYQSGQEGICCAPAGYTYMLAMHSLISRVQMILGWTWRSMLGGEEQYHYGLLGHDGIPLPNYDDYKRIGETFEKLGSYGFPYLPVPAVAVAYNYESAWMSDYAPAQYQMKYTAAQEELYQVFYHRNRDYNVVSLYGLKKEYKLLIVPHHCVMGQRAAATVKEFVKAGGRVVMTGYSGILDETGTAFATSRPGRLTEVFGVRVAAFYRMGGTGERMALSDGKGGKYLVDLSYYEELQLLGAEPYLMFENGKAAVSVHSYGQGKAYYVAVEANRQILGLMVDDLTEELGLPTGLTVPAGIQARRIAPGQDFYVNMTAERIVIPLPEKGTGVLSGKIWTEELELEGYEAELILGN